MHDIKMPFVMSVTGPKRTGKTYFIRKLIEKELMDKFMYIVVLSPTAKLSGDFDFLLKSTYPRCMVESNPAKFEKEVQMMINNLERRQLLRNRTGTGAPNTLLVLDDCATDNILKRQSIIDKYIIRHRHANLSVIVVGHALRGDAGLPKAIRLNVDYNVIFRPVSIMELDSILKDCVFADEVKLWRKAVTRIFSEDYNYLVYQPAETYDRRLLVNFENPLSEFVSNATTNN